MKRKEKQKKAKMETEPLISSLNEFEMAIRSSRGTIIPTSWEACADVLREAQDALYDYSLLSSQCRRMTAFYETDHDPVWENGVYVCPECHRRVHGGVSHCQHCGAKLKWITRRPA